MKKTVFAFLAALVTVSVVNAQAFSNGDNLLSVGVGVGNPYFGSGYSASFPLNPTVSYERGITDDISIGGMLSFASIKYNFAGYKFSESAVYAGARGSYHFNRLLNLDNDDIDLYGGVTLGYVAVNVKDNAGGLSSGAGGAGLGIFAGGKYYFAPNIAAYAELGYTSLSFLNAGITFKF